MQYRNSAGSFFSNIPPIVKNLIIINILMFLASMAFPIFMKEHFVLYYPESPMFRPLQLFTSMFMHADFPHLFFNMWMLFILGITLERYWGPKRFLLFYLITGIGASVFALFTKWLYVLYLESNIDPESLVYMKEYLNENYFRIMNDFVKTGSAMIPDGATGMSDWFLTKCSSSLGASGAIYGLFMAFGMLFPDAEFGIIFLPVRIKAKWMVIILGAIALWSGLKNNTGDNVGHFAHLGGLIFGYILMRYWEKRGGNHIFH